MGILTPYCYEKILVKSPPLQARNSASLQGRTFKKDRSPDLSGMEVDFVVARSRRQAGNGVHLAAQDSTVSDSPSKMIML
jgi:hypothetical protein